jgi:ATP-dependent Clp protease adaptor protein ClpS
MSASEPTAPHSTRTPLFKVMLLNDDETPMEFVVWVLETIFAKPRDEAVSTMLTTHHDGACACGIYDEEQAKSLVRRVKAEARRLEHPLKCVMERD